MMFEVDDHIDDYGNKQKWSRRIIRQFFTISIILLFIGGMIYLRTTYIHRDQDTLCPKDSKPRGVTAVLLDISEPLDGVQQATIRRIIKSFNDAPTHTSQSSRQSKWNDTYVREGDRVTFYTQGNSVDDIRQDGQICNPGDPSSRGVLAPLYSNKNQYKRLWKEYEDKLENYISISQEQAGRKTSPILESMSYVGNREGEGLGQRGQYDYLRLFVISDLMQYSTRYSIYQQGIVNPQQQVIPGESLYKFDVHVILLHRNAHRILQESNDFRRWWTKQVKGMGGQIVRWEHVGTSK